MSQVNKALVLSATLLVILSLAHILTESQESAAGIEIHGVQAVDVQSIKVYSPEQAIELRREEVGWMSVAPTPVPADSGRVEALLSDWAGGMKSHQAVSSSSSESEERGFGLDQQQRRRLTILGASRVLVDLEVGRAVAGGSHYVRLAGTNAVFLARVPAEARLNPSPRVWLPSTD